MFRQVEAEALTDFSFSCRACEAIVQAPPPPKPIARGKATLGTVAPTAVATFDHHLPLYRQAEMMAAQGFEIDRSTLTGWIPVLRSLPGWRTKNASDCDRLSDTLHRRRSPPNRKRKGLLRYAIRAQFRSPSLQLRSCAIRRSGSNASWGHVRRYGKKIVTTSMVRVGEKTMSYCRL